MSVSRGVTLSLLLGFVSGCGGSQTDAGPSAGSGPGSAGAGGAPLSAGSGSGGAGAGAGTGAVDIGAQTASDKLDVLFVIDNSSSMLGKQLVLAKSLPQFVSRLTNPLCVDAQGQPTATQPADAAAACASGSRQFKPIADIHFGAISTSLGSHGGNICTGTTGFPQQDDLAQLLPSKRTGVASYQDSGFLAFDASGVSGERNPTVLADGLSAMITAAGEKGCGFEAPLEAMYRFLVDPEPPVSVEVVAERSTLTGINDVLLAQRRAFLRPDSSLAIVIFSDENDCSIVDSEQGWFLASAPNTAAMLRMPRATSACALNPNDECCRSCALSETSPPSGCEPLAQDSVCGDVVNGPNYGQLDDSLNLRCFDQQRRFGFDYLHPLTRYSDALSNAKIKNRAGALVDNPLFVARDGQGPRSATQVSVSVIVGAPWQDLATPASLSGGPLEYLNSSGLESAGRWPLLIGDAKHNVLPSDPFMVESVEPRMGQNPLTMAAIAPANSTNPQQNPINGHEVPNADRTDLQLACIFPLPGAIDCAPGDPGCDCSPDKSGSLSYVMETNSPLCQPPAGGPPSSKQYYGKAYPGTRELGFARLLGERAVAGSMCPRAVNDPTSPDYGYSPAFAALLGRIAKTVK